MIRSISGISKSLSPNTISSKNILLIVINQFKDILYLNFHGGCMKCIKSRTDGRRVGQNVFRVASLLKILQDRVESVLLYNDKMTLTLIWVGGGSRCNPMFFLFFYRIAWSLRDEICTLFGLKGGGRM